MPDFSAPGLLLSDLLLCTRIEDAGSSRAPRGTVRRRGLDLAPLPWDVVPTGAPVYLYAEAYGLTPSPDGLYRYEIEAALEPVDERGQLARIAGALTGGLASDAPGGGLAVSFQATSDQPDAAPYAALDLSGQPPGRYRLRLTVRDAATGHVAETARTVRLVVP